MTTTLYSWKMPRVPCSQIYGDQKGCFSVLSDHSVLSFEDTISLQNGSVTIQLLTDGAFMKALRRKTSRKQKKRLEDLYLHVGLVQVGVKPLARQAAEDTIVMGLRDARFLDFKKSMLGLVESSLGDGPVYFDCFANLMIPLTEPNLVRALTVNLMSKDTGKTTQGIEPLVFSYRVCCKITSRPHGEKALKESPLGSTKMCQAKIRSNKVVSKLIEWDEIKIPESWLKEEEDRQRKEEEDRRRKEEQDRRLHANLQAMFTRSRTTG